MKGSPARAGIGPAKAMRKSEWAGFPRASGDRPKELWKIGVVYQVPPRERG